ncbi:MAG: hypothetical protein ACTHJX_02250 [Terriglobales bacterium]
MTTSPVPRYCWRPWQPADAAALRRAHAVQCGRLNTWFEFPDLRDPHYVWALTAERNGEAQGVIAAHATLEAMIVGGEAAMMRDLIEHRDWFVHQLRALGADELHAFVPRACLAAMEPLLGRMGFRRSNEAFLPLYQSLEP